ncbi:g12798 [Coccomyxa viridis]|uniref:G12798 protein n=1 Tax=Coccomyxa viridis TaxID=1274662 RepID=A0ABP1GBA0_9CHLO
MSHVYGPDGRVRRPVKKLYTLDKENAERVSRKKTVSSPVACQEESATRSEGAQMSHPHRRGQEERIREMLHSKIRMDSSDGAFAGLTAAAGKDCNPVHARPRCEAKAALYASSIRLRDDVDVSATAAPAQRLVSQLKRLEVSGTAGDLTYPDPEACERRVSRKAPLSMGRCQQASSIILAGDTPCKQDSAAQELPGPPPAPGPTPLPRRRLRARAPTPPSVRRQNRERAPSNRPPPGGVSSVILG